ncbi:MAG: hypothetical protein HRU24_00025 [Gammaproteobacteria bacterium]|nr:hypothetical protein [Gammaproteobacteria bacterium]
MSHNLKNSEYDDDFMIKQIAMESTLFNRYVQDALREVDKQYPTTEIWLGTLRVGGVETQINLTITQETRRFIDEYG